MTCTLCGLDVGVEPLERIDEGTPQRFCCEGCLNVYLILRESGAVASGADLRETDLYKRSLALGLVAAGRTRRRRETAIGVPADAPTAEKLLHVSGMWCGSCAWLIERALTAEPGVRAATVSFAADTLKLTYCPQYLPPDRIERRLASLGYRATADTDAAAADNERRNLWLRLGVAAFLWVNVMMLNVGVYVGYFVATPPALRRFLPWLLMALSAPAVFWAAWPVTRLAIGGLRNRVVRMETLLALGIFAAWIYSAVETVRGGPHIYFDTACAIVTFVLFGKVIERAARERTTRAIRRMYSLLPTKARLADRGGERFVAVEALVPGQRLLVRAGERVPTDGQVVSGASHVDESILTGEAAPRRVETGGAVAGGSLNVDSAIEIVVTRASHDSALAHVVRMVDEALAGRSHIARAVDRATRAFVPAVIVLAAATFFWWAVVAGRPIAEATLTAVTVLIIACPCTLGVATPLALTAAVGAASRLGVLVGRSEALEVIRKVDIVVFDKTGTVTAADFSLIDADWRALGPLGALERFSEHPIGRNVVRQAEARGLPMPSDVRDVEVVRGRGIRGTVDGRRIAIGSRALFGVIPEVLEAKARHHEAEGHTVAFHGPLDAAEGVLAFGSSLVPGAAEVVARLRARGIRTALVSGDSRTAVAHVAKLLGVDEVRADVLPEQKVAVVEEFRSAGHIVAMVGDGINDAPALAAADLGVAVASGTDLAMQAAAVVLMTHEIGRLVDLFDLAHRTFRIVRQNLFWAFAYNTAGLALAATGTLHPIAAVAGMLLSSVSVVGNSYRLANERSTASGARVPGPEPGPRLATSST